MRKGTAALRISQWTLPVLFLALLLGAASPPEARGASLRKFISGELRVTSDPPGARVFLNDNFIGKTMPRRSLRERKLRPGKHYILRLEKEGYQTWWTRFRVGRFWEKKRRKRKFHVTLTRAPGQARVPSVVDLTFEEGARVAGRMGLSLEEAGEVTTRDRSRAGRIGSQSPAAGARIQRGALILVKLYRYSAPAGSGGSPPPPDDGRVKVPSLQNLTAREALADRLRPLGLGIQVVRPRVETRDRSLDGRIASQSPKAGTQVARGSVVRVRKYNYAGGPRQVAVPSLIRKTPREALARLLRPLGLGIQVVGRVETKNCSQRGRIQDQSPRQGTRVRRGSVVRVKVYRYKAPPRGAAQRNWETKACIPTARQFPVSGVIAGQLYVVGGNAFPAPSPTTTALEVYDPRTDTWDTTKAPAPTSRVMAAGAAISGKLYVAGGCINSDCGPKVTNILEVFDPASNTWATLTPMPRPRHTAAAGVIGGRLYVIGGSPGSICCRTLKTLVVFDPSAGPSGTWTILPSMPTAREGLAAGVIGGKLYVVGGIVRPGNYSSAGASTGALEVFNPATNTWTTLAPMPTPRWAHAVGAIGGKLYVVGGRRIDTSNPRGDTGVLPVEVYNPRTGAWSTDTPIPKPRQQLVAGVINGKIYAVSCYGKGVGLTPVLEVFMP